MKSFLFCFFLPCCIAFSQSQKPYFTFQGEYRIKNNTKFQHTLVGGLSGIDYYFENVFYVISDDPGEHGAPRFYKISIDYKKGKGIRKVNILAVRFLTPPPGKLFVSPQNPPVSVDNNIFSDAESIRYDRHSGRFIWSSEGFNLKGLRLQPFVFCMDTNGLFLAKIKTDPVFRFDASGKAGLQHNSAFEAFSLIPESDDMVYCTEKSLFQDIQSLNDTVSPIRMMVGNITNGYTSARFVYALENVFKNNSNGVVEILALSADTFFVLERAYDKQKGNAVRLFRATVSTPANVSTFFPAWQDEDYLFLKKELLLDFSKAGVKHVDNIEGMTWAYPLSENKKSILFISDNNFNSKQVTQFLLFEYND